LLDKHADQWKLTQIGRGYGIFSGSFPVNFPHFPIVPTGGTDQGYGFAFASECHGNSEATGFELLVPKGITVIFALFHVADKP